MKYKQYYLLFIMILFIVSCSSQRNTYPYRHASGYKGYSIVESFPDVDIGKLLFKSFEDIACKLGYPPEGPAGLYVPFDGLRNANYSWKFCRLYDKSRDKFPFKHPYKYVFLNIEINFVQKLDNTAFLYSILVKIDNTPPVEKDTSKYNSNRTHLTDSDIDDFIKDMNITEPVSEEEEVVPSP